MFVTLRFQSACVRKTAQTFPLVFRLFHGVWWPFGGDEIRSSSSRPEWSLSCSIFSIFSLSSSQTLRNQLESLGYLLLSVVFLLRSRTFPLRRLLKYIFFKRHFGFQKTRAVLQLNWSIIAYALTEIYNKRT